ncbi:MAG: type I-E CRISPR-associated protein Cas5/CasD [Thermodesulfobacteriota bacterium]
MTDYLIFRLYGPMASWGEIAVGEVRPSATHPSKSAVLGLVAAALRLDRDQEEMHQRLADAYGFAVRVDCMGVPLVDYHTAQVPPSGSGRNRRTCATRREELTTLPRHKLSTILSRRDYRMDALAVVALWTRIVAPPYALAAIRDALERPGYVL